METNKPARLPGTILDYEQKIFIITSLAQFNAPSETQRLFSEQYGIEIGVSSLGRYDPTKADGQQMKQELKDLFFKVRAEYMENEAIIPIAHRFVRLLRLEKEYHNADLVETRLKVLEQAAKEVGGAYAGNKVGFTAEVQNADGSVGRFSVLSKEDFENIARTVADEI